MGYFANKHIVTRSSSGFTIIEVVVTVVVVSLFLVVFLQSYMLLESQRINVARQAQANDIAYSNLRKVLSRPAQLLDNAVCTSNAAVMDLTTGTPATKPGLDITTYGYTLEPVADVRQALGSSATQSLRVFAPTGCVNFDKDPIKIVSTVTYGGNGDKVTHASYVK